MAREFAWWEREFRRPWREIASVAVTVGIGVSALLHGRWDMFTYGHVAAGAIALCAGVATWAYRRRHPQPRKESALDRALG